MNALVSILVPAYNERPYVRRCVEKVLAAPLPEGLEREVLVVDDGSTDGTGEVLAELAQQHPGVVRPIVHAVNQGKGASLRDAVREMKGQYAIFQDADLEYDPRDYRLLLEPLLHARADVVFGSRFTPAAMRRVLNYHHAVANHALTTVSNFFTGLNLTDMETGYKAFRADVLRTIPIRSRGFGIEPEITAKVAKRNCIVYEVPISYHGRTYREGKKIRARDAFLAVLTTLKYWLIDDCYESRYGHEILADLSQARRFNSWMAGAISPWLGSSILEIGSGIGNMTRNLPQREHLTASDNDPQYLALLDDAFRNNELVDVRKLDLTSDRDFAGLADAGRPYDTVVCLNVLEHVEDDRGAVRRMASALAPGGRLVVLVPQYGRLYGSYDKALGHCRRYQKSELKALMRETGLEVVATRSFNCFAMAGWWVNGCLLKRRSMGRFQIKLFDALVPVLRSIEALVPLPGISLICVGKKGESGDSALRSG